MPGRYLGGDSSLQDRSKHFATAMSAIWGLYFVLLSIINYSSCGSFTDRLEERCLSQEWETIPTHIGELISFRLLEGQDWLIKMGL